MARTGLTRADYEDEDVEVWPCCWESVLFARQMGHGAWEYGMNGACRLDYQTVVNVLFDHHGIKKKQRKALFADLQAMEIPALNAMHEK